MNSKQNYEYGKLIESSIHESLMSITENRLSDKDIQVTVSPNTDDWSELNVSINIKASYYKFITFDEMPKNCKFCPIGYVCHDCGRPVNITKITDRPESCKLISLSFLNNGQKEELTNSTEYKED